MQPGIDVKTSWQIARIAGISVNVHVTFPLLLIWIAAADFQARGTWGDLARDTALVIILVAIVVLHELGHALTARRFGIRTHDITLFPIGGVAHLERMPEKPRQELAVALAGPAVNVVLAAILFGAFFATADWETLGEVAVLRDNFVVQLAWLNLAMAAFNLLPAFPMDGGRVLRAVLALRMNYVRATTLAAAVGKAFAIGLGVIGIFANPFLILIAIFVWTAADAEAQTILIKASLSRVPAERMCIRHFQTLSSDLTLAEAVDRVLSCHQPIFPVLQNGNLVGLLSRRQLRDSIGQHAGSTGIAEIMEDDFSLIDASDNVAAVVTRLRESPLPELPVMRHGEIIGLLGLGHLAEFAAFHATRHAPVRGSRPHVQIDPRMNRLPS